MFHVPQYIWLAHQLLTISTTSAFILLAYPVSHNEVLLFRFKAAIMNKSDGEIGQPCMTFTGVIIIISIKESPKLNPNLNLNKQSTETHIGV